MTPDTTLSHRICEATLIQCHSLLRQSTEIYFLVEFSCLPELTQFQLSWNGAASGVSAHFYALSASKHRQQRWASRQWNCEMNVMCVRNQKPHLRESCSAHAMIMMDCSVEHDDDDDYDERKVIDMESTTWNSSSQLDAHKHKAWCARQSDRMLGLLIWWVKRRKGVGLDTSRPSASANFMGKRGEKHWKRGREPKERPIHTYGFASWRWEKLRSSFLSAVMCHSEEWMAYLLLPLLDLG